MGCLKHRQGASVKVGNGINLRVKRGKNGFPGFVYKWVEKQLERKKIKASGKSGNSQGEVKV